MTQSTKEDIRAVVRRDYGAIARGEQGGCCGPKDATFCAPGADASLALGYSSEELQAVPEGANMGLGCGNPQAIAALSEGETVLDLGAGGGFDCFLAARAVGPTGKVIGVDMTADMVRKARENAEKLGTTNVEFRLGEIEHLPVEDSSVDAILSNCVINLSPDKAAVFRDAFRVLRPGGRLAISDVVALRPLPERLQKDVAALIGCAALAAEVEVLEDLLREAGFEDTRIRVNPKSREFIKDWLPGFGIEEYVASASIEATRPGGDACCPPACCPSNGER